MSKTKTLVERAWETWDFEAKTCASLEREEEKEE